MRVAKLLQQPYGQRLLGGITRVFGRLGGTRFGRDPGLLEMLPKKHHRKQETSNPTLSFPQPFLYNIKDVML
jgi:hypothetical protein